VLPRGAIIQTHQHQNIVVDCTITMMLPKLYAVQHALVWHIADEGAGRNEGAGSVCKCCPDARRNQGTFRVECVGMSSLLYHTIYARKREGVMLSRVFVVKAIRRTKENEGSPGGQRPEMWWKGGSSRL
jgi:hypothetical protein